MSCLSSAALESGLLSPQTVYELRHNVLEDMEIQCRAAELKANSQSLALRRQMPLAGSAQNPRGLGIPLGLPAWVHPLSCGLLPKHNIPWSPFSQAQAVPGHLAGVQPLRIATLGRSSLK